MTQEQKAKAYDEALERAKEWKEKYSSIISSDGTIAKDFDLIFPELAESEDERIRKALIDLVSTVGEYYLPKLETRNKMLAYLEKQKEQERISDSAQYEEGFKTGLEIGLRKQKEQKPIEVDESTKRLNDNWMKQHFDEYTEQKPAECIPDSVKFDEGFKTGREVGFREGVESVKPAEWDDYTKTNLGRAIQIIKDARGTLYGYQTDDGIYECDKAIEALEHFLYRGLEIEKPAEWSEEDKEMLMRCVAAIPVQGDEILPTSYLNKLRNWLESILERFNLQPKQEWSEEDRNITEELYEYFRYLQLTSDKEFSPSLSIDEILKWLKSLRPSWKPSEEQMEALNALNCYGDLSYVGQQNQLISLYNDLKKLM